MKKITRAILAAMALGTTIMAGCSICTSTSSVGMNDETSTRTTSSTTVKEDDSWKKDVIYFMFVDRFYDGNSSNNNGNNPLQYDASKTQWKKYWGGDLAGLNQKLDYLKDMGINSIWVTPLVDGIDELTNDGDAPFHGYWSHDNFNIDEHLGTWNEFDELVNKMHSDKYNMRLCLDYAPNHTNPNDEGERGRLYRTTYDSAGNITGRRTVIPSFDDDSTGMYHHNGGVNNWNDYSQVRNNNLFNLSDLNQSNDETYNYLADALEMWLKRGIDEVRIDAVKHMDIDFTKNLVNDMQNRLGKQLFIYGEWAGAGAQVTSGVDSKAKELENTTDCNLLDFGYRAAVEDMFLGKGNAKTLAKYLTDRETYFTNPGKQVVFLDNHDMARLNTTLRSAGNMSAEMAARKTDIGLALTLTVRGVPCIYYGTENYDANFTKNSFGKTGDDPYNRNMMTSFDGNTNAYKIIKTLANLRQTNTALQDGKYQERWQDETVIAFQRVNGNDVVATFVNNGYTDRSLTISNMSFDTGTYSNLIGSGEVKINSSTATLTIPANSAIVIAHTNNDENNPGNDDNNPDSGDDNPDSGDDNPIVQSRFSVNIKTGSSKESISFPGDYNSWSLTANTITVAPNSEVSFSIENAITSANISNGDNNNTLELKLVTNESWNNQWNFSNWKLDRNITLADNNRQINIACAAGNNVTLTIDIAKLTLTADVK